MRPPGRGGWWIFLVTAALTCVFIINLCSAVYGCGCRSLWAGTTRHCNIHVPEGKHCPWCSIGNGGFAAVLGLILGPQFVLSFRPKRWPWIARLAAAGLAFPVLGTVVALVTGWLTGYWGR